MTGDLVYAPLLPWPIVAALAALAGVACALALWRGLPGWWLRGLGAVALVAALAGPHWQVEVREPLTDIVILLEDRSASQRLSDRPAQSAAAADAVAAAIASREGTELRRVVVGDAEGDGGTRLMMALAGALAEEPGARIAGVVVVSDGRVHDLGLAPTPPAPTHLLLTGRRGDWDRRLVVGNAPAFAIIGEQVTLTLRAEDSGDFPPGATSTPIDMSVGGAAPRRFAIPIGRDVDIPVTLPHGGPNVIEFSIPVAEGEITDRNNTALIRMNGVRDRLRVLLVSGQPHAGSRVWRNLLKSDSSVDLVHFTILRPPEKQDGVPVEELSLIAFPTRELFLEKIDDFDLIVFDRYKRRGILPAAYLENVVRYVEDGGAVLVAAGPDFAGASSIYRTALAGILPAQPTARVIEARYVPEVTELGERHPVTADIGEGWGAWMRQVELVPVGGQKVMAGAADGPLLLLDRVGEGRVALLGSDQAWLWSRGFEGGGPQLELLRRLAHWMMKEPELEEEYLTAEVAGQGMRVIRRTLAETAEPVTIRRPDGGTDRVELEAVGPGQFEAAYEATDIGLYVLQDSGQRTVVGLGPASLREFEETIASGEALEPVVASRLGGIRRIEDGIPALRDVREGRPAAGRGWIGITPRNAFETRDISRTPLMPAWLALALIAALVLGAWIREGRS